MQRRRVGDEVLGWSAERHSHAELVAVAAEDLVPKPADMRGGTTGPQYLVDLVAAGELEIPIAP